MHRYNVRVVYWIVTTLFCLLMLGSAISELTNAPLVRHSLEVLGYPLYLLPFLGALKLLGIVALVLPRAGLLREWAYAGFVFDLGGALFSILAVRAFSLDDAVVAPIAVVLCLSSYFLRRLLKTEVPETALGFMN